MRAPLLSRSHKRRSRFRFPIEVFFDGDAQEFFIGGWSEAGGNVLNDKLVLGSELLTNGGMETFTGGLANGWTEQNTPTTTEENTIVDSGGSSQQIDADEVNEGVFQVIVTTSGLWYRVLGANYSDGTNNALIVIRVGSDPASGDPLARLDNITAAWVSLLAGFRAESASTILVSRASTAASYTIYADSHSIKQITFTSLINVLKSQFGLSDGFFIDVHINAVTAGNQIGVIWNYDGSNNFGMAYMDGTNLIVDKNVNGTYSNLASVAQAVTQDQILRIENPAGTNVLDILYNGVSKATPTIADASVIGNEGIALFSTEANNAISRVVIGKL